MLGAVGAALVIGFVLGILCMKIIVEVLISEKVKDDIDG